MKQDTIDCSTMGPGSRSRCSLGCDDSKLLRRLLRGCLPFIPIQDLLAVPVQHAIMPRYMIVDLFEIFDAVRLARDVRVDRQRTDLGALVAFGVEPVELVDRALQLVIVL